MTEPSSPLSPEMLERAQPDRHPLAPPAARGNYRRGPLSEEHRARISASMKGLKRSDEFKAKCGAAHRGKKLTPEHREKVRAGAVRAGVMKRLWQDPAFRAKVSASTAAANRLRKGTVRNP